MSEFSNVNKLICKEEVAVPPAKDPCKPKPQEVSCSEREESESEVWYDSQKKRYYAVQTHTAEKQSLKSSEYTEAAQLQISPDIAKAAKDRIINYFNLRVSDTMYKQAIPQVEKVTVSDKSSVPVKFLIYYSKDSLGNDRRIKPTLDLETNVISGKTFFRSLDKLHKSLKLYSRYQSILFSFDKIKLIKEDSKPFYLSLVSQRLLTFTTEIKKLFMLNDVDMNNMGDVVFYVEADGSKKKILDIMIDNKSKKQYNDNLTIGVQEFLGNGFLEDEDMVSYVLNVNKIISAGNTSWIDTVINFGHALKIQTDVTNELSGVPCFSNLDFNFDVNLDLDLDFSEKLEYLFHKKNSFSLEDAFRTQTVLIPDTDGAVLDFDSLIDSAFKKLRENTSTYEVLDFDNPFDILEESLKNYSFEDGFDQVYQFLGLESFTIMMNKLLVNFQKMSSAGDMVTLVTDTFMQNLNYDATILILERIPSTKRFELLEELKDVYNSDLDIEEFAIDYAETLKNESLEDIKKRIKEFLKNNPAIDVFSGIPEFQKIAQVFNLISSTNIDIATPLDLLSGLLQDGEASVFSEKLFKLPNLPDLPSFKFSIIEFIQENLLIILKKAVGKIISIIIQKLIGFIQNFVTDGLTNSRPQGNEGDYNITDGLGQFISRFLCDENPEDLLEENTVPDKDPEEAKDALLKEIIPSDNITDESYLKLAEVIGSNSTISDIIDAVTEDDEVRNNKFVNKLTDAVQTEAPEFKAFFKDSNDTKTMFRNIRNFISPQTLNTLRDFNNTYQDTPFATTYCLKKDDRERWIDDKRAGLQESGFTGEAAKKYVDDKLEQIKDDTCSILDLTVNGFQDRLFDNIEDILNGDPECEDLYASQEAKEIIQETRGEQKQVENLMLEKINSTFVEDLISDNQSNLSSGKGILSRIMADKYGRSMSEVKSLKDSPILSLLLQVGIVPKPEFPETIGSVITENLGTNLLYTPTATMTTFGKQEEKPFSAFFNNILFLTEKTDIKTEDLIIEAPKSSRPFDVSVDTVDVKYIDYKSTSERQFEYYIQVSEEMLINSRLKIPQDILDSYPDISNINKSEFISLLLPNNVKYHQNDWVKHNKLIFSQDMISAMGFNNDIDFGYPAETTRQKINELWEQFEDSGDINVEVEGMEHIQILDPETYGTFFGKPRLHASPKKIPDGYLKDSEEFYNKKTDIKLNKTILNLESIKTFIDEYSEKLKKSEFSKTSAELLVDSPFFKVDDEKKLANSQGMVKTYIRSYIAEHIFLAYNVWKNVGFDIDETTMATYIFENIKKENKNIKIPTKGVYNQFIIYVLMLMSNAEAYINFHDDSIATELKEIDENYEYLQREEIEYLKNNTVTIFDKKYENYTLGYYGISFQEKYKPIHNAAKVLPLSSNNMTSNEIKFTSKIGYALSNIDILEQVFVRTIEEEIRQYKNIYPAEKNIYLEFLKVLTGQDNLFSEQAELDEDDWSTSSYYVLKPKDLEEQTVSKDDLVTILEDVPYMKKTTMNISEMYGNAKLTENSYEGTIGIKYGVGIYYKKQLVAAFSEDVPDTLISEFLNDLNNNDNYNSTLIDHDCYVRNLLKTKEARIILDLAFQVKKLPTILSIYNIENLVPSINLGQNEYKLALESPLSLAGDMSSFLASKYFGRAANLLETKKEIKQSFLFNYTRKFYDPPLDNDKTFFDSKNAESAELSVDYKNFQVDTIVDAATIPTSPSLLQKFSFVDDLELDKDGLPIMNKFLSNFKEE